MNPIQEETFSPSSDQKTSEWIAVLAAAGLDYHLSHQPEGWTIHVPPEHSTVARVEITAYEEDLKGWPSVAPAPLEPAPASPGGTSPLWVCGLMITFYMWLGPYNSGSAPLREASVDAEAFLGGEWWRVITGLTIHSDPTHLAGNILSLLLLGYAVCLSFGGGLGWALILATGIAGNTAACIFHGPGHLSVGASTACFGALGLLSTRQAIRNLRHHGLAGGIWSRTWIPLGAGIAVLTMLGTGQGSDLAAHAFGFACGLLFCVPFSPCNADSVPPWAQRILQLACITVVMTAWRAALNAAAV